MTASSPRLSIAVLAVVLGACRAGLPPEPPGMDPADPEAPIGRPVESPSPFERSAFEGETLDEGGHDHGAHAGHGKAAEEGSGHRHGGEGADEPQHHHGEHGGSR